MRPRPWHLLLALAALIVPLQALGGPSGGGPLTVSASLDYCGVAQGGITCKLDASWSGVAEADRYTATVTGADGSVVDLGTVGIGPDGGSTSLWVPYSGSGTYTITVTAWGTNEKGKPEKVDKQEAEAIVKDKDEAGDEPRPDEASEEQIDAGGKGKKGKPGAADQGGADQPAAEEALPQEIEPEPTAPSEKQPEPEPLEPGSSQPPPAAEPPAPGAEAAPAPAEGQGSSISSPAPAAETAG